MLYWDSEMFHRSTKNRRELEGEDKKDYRALLKDMLFIRRAISLTPRTSGKWRSSIASSLFAWTEWPGPRDYKKMYGGLIAGDPKLRTLRAIYQDISCAYAAYAKSFRKGGEANG